MPDLKIPVSFNALDQDAQGIGQGGRGGYPASSALGREITHNDRWLWANLRRHHVAHAWPRPELAGSAIVAKPPVVGLVAGHNVGPWRSIGTPGVTEGEWYVVARVSAYGQLVVMPYCNHPDGPEPLRSPLANVAFNLTNPTGSVVEKIIGPISTALVPGLLTVGLVFYSMQPNSGWYPANEGLMSGDVLVAGSEHGGAARLGTNLSLVKSATASDFSAIAVAAGAGVTGYVLRLVNKVDNSIILTDWHDILYTTEGVAGDANGGAVVYPAFTEDGLAGQRIQTAPISTVQLLSVTLREEPASGVLEL